MMKLVVLSFERRSNNIVFAAGEYRRWRESFEVQLCRKKDMLVR